ncbi:MAG TPA: DUF4339 domain-containing protein [bacterium]|nr:DUF4339 domain-containing protein [bacterium]
MAGWYLFRGEQVEGPFSAEALVALDGVFPSSKVCAEGTEEWEALADIEPLYAAYQAARTQPAKAAATGGMLACHYHPTVPGSVLCSYCSRNLCEECARKDGENIICTDCIAKRTELLDQQEAERQRLLAEKQAHAAAELAAATAAKKMRLVIIVGAVVVVLAIVGVVIKFGYSAYQLTQQQSQSADPLP